MREPVYTISDNTLNLAVSKFARALMKGQKGWKNDPALGILEFQIEGIIKEHLENYGGIKFEI
jgi:hypothetical protein